jgi:spore coat protein U-like protein
MKINYNQNMGKQIKLLSILCTTLVLSGVSTFSILTTSCGNKVSDTITFNSYNATMYIGIDSQTISATCSNADPVTLEANGSGKDTY